MNQSNIFQIRYSRIGRTLHSFHAPIHVRSCGHYKLNQEFRDNPLQKNFIELFWVISGTVRFGFRNRDFLLEPRTVFFYLPGDFHDITTPKLPAEYCFLTIDGTQSPDLIKAFQLKQKIYRAGICPINLFHQLEQYMSEYSIRGEYLAGATAYQILSLALAGNFKEKPLFEQFRELVLARYNEPGLRIEDIANELQVHRTTLNRCLEVVSGISPQEYLNTLRMQEALERIKNSNCSFKEIALDVGFSDPDYFTKSIRRYFGQTPSQLRQNQNDQPFEVNYAVSNPRIFNNT